ncbi:MAG: protein translocase subunit SecD, partial [Anaerovoracaceae bacterium]
ANPTVSVEAGNRIRIELPGAEDAEEAIKQIGKTAQLKFTLADKSLVLDGGSVKDATTGQNKEKGGYVVNLEFDSEGAKAFEKATTITAGGGVPSTLMLQNGTKVQDNAIVIKLDNEIISAPSAQSVISGGKCEISGSFSQKEATNLAALIRGGSLPVELKEVTSSAQTAKIGLDALEMSIYAGIIGAAIIFLIMLVGYRIMGVAADIALTLYILIMLAVMALMGSVLTLPGIAGIILSVGMAVDANVVIFTRIKEEINNGRSIRVATQTGYKRAMSTVIDSQVTTLIAAIILYQIGTSSVKGFAWTLMIGIFASIFTAVLITQLYLSIISESKRFAKNKYFGLHEDGSVMFKLKKEFKFVKHRKIFYIISVAIIAVGILAGGIRGFNYGIDFTGGTMLHLDMGKKVSAEEIKTVAERHDINTAQMEIVYAGDNQEEVIIKTN